MASKDYCAIGWRYAEQVAAGTIPNGRYAIAACERSLRDRDNQHTQAFPYIFNETKANKVCNFIECLPHVKGSLAGQLIVLEPWQIWLITQLFGWLHATGVRVRLRRFRKAYIEVGRGNAKSTISSAIGLYCLTIDEPQANVFSCATTRDQAKLVWGDAKAMAANSNPLTRKLMARLGVDTHAHSIAVASTNSSFVSTSSDATSQDGLNVSLAIIDEVHVHKTRDMWDVMVTGAGKRANSLILAITTAGFDRGGVCFEQHLYLRKLLDQVAEDESQFGCIWAADEKDDFTLPITWEKANPNYNISVDPSHLENEARKAANVPSAQNAFRTKHLCQWVSASSAWMDMKLWDACADPILKIEDFAGKECFLGLDLASVSDIAAKVYLFPEKRGDETHYTLFADCYLSEDAIQSGKNSQYKGWQLQGFLTQTSGNVTDYGQIEDDIKLDLQRFDVKEIAFDPWQAQQMIQNLQTLNANVVEVRPTYASISEPMKELDRLVRTGRLHHDGNPVMSWAMSNTVAVADGKENIRPDKDRPENKIDPVVAAIMALARGMMYVEQSVELKIHFV